MRLWDIANKPRLLNKCLDINQIIETIFFKKNCILPSQKKENFGFFRFLFKSVVKMVLRVELDPVNIMQWNFGN